MAARRRSLRGPWPLALALCLALWMPAPPTEARSSRAVALPGDAPAARAG
jgi:hypothetical protein